MKLAWASSNITYDAIASSLAFDFDDVTNHSPAHWAQQLLSALGDSEPPLDLFDDATDDDRLQAIVIRIFTNALQAPPSQFERLLPGVVQQGLLSEVPSSEDLKGEHYLVQTFYRCITGSSYLLGTGLNKLRVSLAVHAVLWFKSNSLIHRSSSPTIPAVLLPATGRRSFIPVLAPSQFHSSRSILYLQRPSQEKVPDIWPLAKTMSRSGFWSHVWMQFILIPLFSFLLPLQVRIHPFTLLCLSFQHVR